MPSFTRRGRGSLRQLQGRSGTAALEALISIIFLFIVIYAMWGVALIIYNQTKLTTATQLASQAALVTYDRSTYRGRDVANLYSKARMRAYLTASSVFRENTCGMLPAQFSTEAPLDVCDDPPAAPIPGFSLDVSCAETLLTSFWHACNTGGDDALALRTTVRSAATSPYFFLEPFRSTSDGPERDVIGLEAQSRNYGYAASLPAGAP